MRNLRKHNILSFEVPDKNNIVIAKLEILFLRFFENHDIKSKFHDKLHLNYKNVNENYKLLYFKHSNISKMPPLHGTKGTRLRYPY